MSILAIGDPHAKISALDELRLLSKRIIEMVETHHPDFIVLLGDLHNDFEKMHILCNRAVDTFFRNICDVCKVYYIIGNHCLINNRCFLTNEHAFNAFKGLSNLTIVDNVLQAYNCTFVPYVPPGRFLEALNTSPGWQDSKVIFCHQEFKNAKLGVLQSTIGDEWGQDLPLCVSGHIHDQGWLQKNILYVGSSRYINYGDTGPKGVALIDLQPSKKITILPLNMPKKETIRIDANQFEELEIHQDFPIRLIITGKLEEIATIKKMPKYKELRGLHKIVFSPVSIRPSLQVRHKNDYMTLMKAAIQEENEVARTIFEELISNAPKA